ncbi:MAG: hypothetical protein ACYTBV_00560 [Planctomycetota bacterium]|jgi:hypothetical protein
MTIDKKSNPMSEFFERLGHNIVRSQSSWWYEVQPKVLLTLPYYKPINPPNDEIKELIIKYKLRALRYPTALDSFGFLSDITVNTNKNYDLSSLHQKARNQTRRGLENCLVKQIDFDYLYKSGMKLNRDTATRQERKSQFCDDNYWKKYCQAGKSTEGASAWGAFINNELASFLISLRTENKWQEWVVNHSSTELRNKYPNNALVFTVAQHFFQNEDCEGICYGLGSLEETAYLDHFKNRMGWQIKPIKQRLVFSNFLKCLFLVAQEPCLKILNKAFPKNYNIRKTSAMIRLNRQQTYNIPRECDR